MVYCTANDVRLLVSTTLEDSELEHFIAQASAEIDKRIGAQSTSDQAIEKLCALITAYIIKLQSPQVEALGDLVKIDAGVTLELWRDEIERLYRLYKTPIVKSSEYASIDEEARYPG